VKYGLKTKIVLLILIFFAVSLCDAVVFSAPKKSKSVSVSSNKKKKEIISKNKSSNKSQYSKKEITSKNKSFQKSKYSKSAKKKRKPKIYVRKVALNEISILETKKLAEGVEYKKVQFGKDPLKIIAHLVEADFDSTQNKVCVLKARNNVTGLDYLKNIYDDYHFELTRIYEGDLLALVNANFWSAYLNYPIGLLISDGEVISMKKYKEWSSVLFDKENRPYIDNFELFGEIIFPNKERIEIDNVNKRTENDNVVVYNKYFGDSLPKIYVRDLEKMVEQTIKNMTLGQNDLDTFEIEIDTNQVRNQILKELQYESKEYSTIKYAFQYLEKPIINERVKVKLLQIDTGVVAIPSDGFVLSLPLDFKRSRWKVGDVAELFFYTNKLRYIEFENGVSGTPRLVRKGVARHEAYQEGSRGYRFIGAQLPRTCLGTNMSKTKLYLIYVETSRSSGSLGANLTQLATIAKKLGCYDAVNLDGGGSSSMVINGEKVAGTGNSNGRKISVAIGVLKNSK